MTATRRAIVLVDGEHHPPVVRAAVDALVASGTDVVEAVVLGGGEKLAAPGVPPDLGVPAHWPAAAEHDLPEVLGRARPDVVVDLSGEPVVDAPRRLRLAAVALSRGVPYEAPGLRYDPPPRPRLADRPSIAVVATGKRTGKTAMSGALARHLRGRGRIPIVVAMGRGGPRDPVVVPAGEPMSSARLLEVAANGGHAASDFYEDAVMTGAATIGCYRVGEGPAGEVGPSNVPAGLEAAKQVPGDVIVLEGSGAGLPPCAADATLLVVPATVPLERLAADLPLKFVLADAVVVTFAGPPLPAPRVAAVESEIRHLLARLPRLHDSDAIPDVWLTRFRPHPLGDVSGQRVFFATTAPEPVAAVQAADLEVNFGAEVVATTTNLSNRPDLLEDLAHAPDHDVVVTELKAAAVDVVARAAAEAGVETVFCDNRAEVVDDEGAAGGPPEALFDALLTAADARFAPGPS